MKSRLCPIFGLAAAIIGSVILSLCLAPQAFGMSMYHVLTGSMEPGIPAGSVVYAAAIQAGEPRAGGVIVYDYGGTPVIHRVIDVLPDGAVIAKGDANPEPDPEPVDPVNIIGRTVFVIPGPNAGRLHVLMRVFGGLAVLMGVCILIAGAAGRRKLKS